MARYNSVKTYGHDVGLSCAFRQWRAESHCRFMHGYSLSFEFVFAADELDNKNWVVDFGGLKRLKRWLKQHFDHKTAVAFDDPMYETFERMHNDGIIDMVAVESTGCEKFAEMAWNFADSMIQELYGNRCWVESVTVREHGANSAIYRSEDNAHRD